MTILLTGLLLLASCGTEPTVVEPQTQDTAGESEPAPIIETEGIQISEDELYDKLLGGWIGQMAGVTWAASTEFRWCGQIIPEKDFPVWSPSMINDAFGQDDLYVEIPFLDAMKENGAECDGKYLAEKFRDSQFPLWHANVQGRANLRNGIEYPESGSYLYNYHADDIDWQIECDFLGQMYPGLVNDAALRAFDLGHIMNYGDGVYGGVFITAMHAAAYTADSIDEIVEAGLAVIPEGTLFKELMNDVMASYKNGDTWQENWQTLEDKWAYTDRCIECSGAINIDAKLNSAYVLIGLLYGNGDFAETIRISGRCGQDSDCNPSSAASILGNFYGASGIPETYKEKLDYSGRKFSNTDYTLEEVLAINFDLMKQILSANGFERSDDGVWTLTPDTAYEAVPFEQWPDVMSVMMQVTEIGNKAVKIQLLTFGGGEAASMRFDMGDGFVSDIQPAYYIYEEPGTYEIHCTVVDTSGNETTVKQQVTVEELDYIPGEAICTVTAPTGGGNKNLGIIYDGAAAAAGDTVSANQYDTYDGGKKRDSVYAGVQFDCSAKLTGVKFTEGMHFWDGGWFESDPVVEVLVDGTWTAAASTVSPDYPAGSSADHGASFEEYTFAFAEPIVCDGVRIAGAPGGASYFISVSEITPIAEEIYGDASDANKEKPIIVCSVSNPTGGGSSDITVISDGVVPVVSSANDKMQYDTYTGAQGSIPAYIGYLYREEQNVSEISFTEGNHFNNGGWWKDGEVWAEVYVDGQWIRPECTVSPAYPKGNIQSVFGNGYQTYTFTFSETVSCTGVRLNGTAGGSAGFISVSELTVK